MASRVGNFFFGQVWHITLIISSLFPCQSHAPVFLRNTWRIVVYSTFSFFPEGVPVFYTKLRDIHSPDLVPLDSV